MKEKIVHLFKYGFWGVITSVINLFLFEFFICCGMDLVLSNVISYWIAVALSYFFNVKFVFYPNKDEKKVSEIGRYLIVRIASIIIDSILLWVFVRYLIPNELISKLIVSTLIILGTYFCNKTWVFRE